MRIPPGAVRAASARLAVLGTFGMLSALGCARAAPPLEVVGSTIALDTAVSVILLPAGIAAPGPRHEVTLELPADYRVNVGLHAAPVRAPDGGDVAVRGAFVDASGRRYRFDAPGTVGSALELAVDTDSVSARRVVRLELAANRRVPIVGVRWWSGDPASRCGWGCR